MDVCRVCMRDVDTAVDANIFESVYKFKRLQEMLESVLQEFVEVSDPGPHYICADCHTKVTLCHDFMQTYSKSKIVFNLLTKSQIFKRSIQQAVETAPSPKKEQPKRGRKRSNSECILDYAIPITDTNPLQSRMELREDVIIPSLDIVS